MKFRLSLTADRLRELLSYNPDDGLFRWRINRNGVVAGKIAGHINARGRRCIGVDGTVYLAARLAWLYTHGTWPAEEIDHVNRVSSDDRFSNLREANRSQNCLNRGAMGASGVWGVREKNGRWQARVMVAGRQVHLGYFAAKHDAAAAAAAKRRELYGDRGASA